MKLFKKARFQWDTGNKDKNKQKHNVTIKEIEEAFSDTQAHVFPDVKHTSEHEVRFHLFAQTKQGQHLLIAFTIRAGKIRPISARPMKQKEVNIYEKATQRTTVQK